MINVLGASIFSFNLSPQILDVYIFSLLLSHILSTRVKDIMDMCVCVCVCVCIYKNPPIKKYFNWRIMPLQYCDGFCHTSTWINHRYTYVPPNHPDTPSLCPSHPIPLGCPRPQTLSAVLQASNFHWSSILHMVIYMFECYSLKSFHFAFSHWVQ